MERLFSLCNKYYISSKLIGTDRNEEISLFLIIQKIKIICLIILNNLVARTAS